MRLAGSISLVATGFADTAALDAAAHDAAVPRKPFAVTRLVAAVEESFGAPAPAA